LVDHLRAVAGGCGNANGSPEDRLAFLAGLAHDAAKAAADWQAYANRGGTPPKGPPHAPTGAALFAFWAEDLLSIWCAADPLELTRLLDLALDWTRLIDQHHGALDDLSDLPPWDQERTAEEHEPATLLATCDCSGLDALVRCHFPALTVRLSDFPAFLESFNGEWAYRQRTGRITHCDQSRKRGALDLLGLRLPGLGARLIYADRRHAGDWKPVALTAYHADRALPHFEQRCLKHAEEARKDGVAPGLLQARRAMQAEAVASYQADTRSNFLTLRLPTGYGKTLAGLRVALEAVRTGRCRRILYVAPYISILSQSARELEKATGLRVVLHHQMSILGPAVPAGAPAGQGQDRQAEDHQPYDLLDTWQAPIVATTFNQLFRALFPKRAQECLRIPALDNAFIFIDEPQIISPANWSAFLRALARVGKDRSAQVLFCTATLPPLELGLGGHGPARPLVGEVPPAAGRFVIRSIAEPWKAERVAEEAESRRNSAGSVAVILNTVADAVNVFRRLRRLDIHWDFLAARVLPGHKERVIRRIQRLLREKTGPPVGVVCTQVLEAGVDLSFRAILRARPIFSSIVQAAGRANRHGEGPPAEVIVFPFVREDGTDPRKFVYRDPDAVRFTDELLNLAPEIPESEAECWLQWYFKKCWEANRHVKSLEYFEAAAHGQWSQLAKLEPFHEDQPGADVFVPGAERYLPTRFQPFLKQFKVETARQLLEVYLDRHARRKLSYAERRLQSALLRQFLVDVPSRLAPEISAPLEGSEWPLVLADARLYSGATGLAHLLVHEDDSLGSGTRVC
jgi:CRISPR-associated helicase Cas3